MDFEHFRCPGRGDELRENNLPDERYEDTKGVRLENLLARMETVKPKLAEAKHGVIFEPYRDFAGNEQVMLVDHDFYRGMQTCAISLTKDLWDTGDTGQQLAIEIIKAHQGRF